MEINELLTNIISKYLLTNNKSNEIEFRFGKYEGTFISGVSLNQYRCIFNEYKDKQLIIPEYFNYLNIFVSGKRVQILDNKQKQITEFCNTNKITNSMNYTVITKDKDNIDDSLNDYGIRLSLSSEKNIVSKDLLNQINTELETTSKPITYRFIKRHSFNICPGLKLDLSQTRTIHDFNLNTMNIKKGKISFEIELEIYDYIKFTEEFNKLIFEHVYSILLLLNGGFMISSHSEKFKNLNLFKEKYDYNICAQNVPLTKKNIDEVKYNNYVFTDKADGYRDLLFVNKKGEMYLINSSEEIFFTGLTNNEIADSLLDGELIFIKDTNKYEFYIFDILFLCGKSLRELEFYDSNEVSIYNKKDEEFIVFGKCYYKQYNFYNKKGEIINEYITENKKIIKYYSIKDITPFLPKTRYGNILYLFTNISNKWETDKLKIKYKSFYPRDLLLNVSDFRIIKINSLTQTVEIPDSGYELDGLIFQSAKGTYPKQIDNLKPQWLDSFKWKFLRNITIDFKISNIFINSEKNVAKCDLLDRSGKIFTTTEFPLVNGKLLTKDNKNVNLYDIIECNYENNNWNIIKIRTDKTEGNAYKTITSTYELIKNPVMLDELLD